MRNLVLEGYTQGQKCVNSAGSLARTLSSLGKIVVSLCSQTATGFSSEISGAIVSVASTIVAIAEMTLTASISRFWSESTNEALIASPNPEI